jgi:FMN phosphatase YigB (HAD superfamily)
MPGVEAILRELNSNGIPTACLSNTNSLHWRLLGEDSPYPSVRILDRRFGSHEIGARKPSDAAYAAVEACFPGRRIAIFDDSPVNVRAAEQRGWAAWTIHPDTSATAIRQALIEVGVLGPRL